MGILTIVAGAIGGLAGLSMGFKKAADDEHTFSGGCLYGIFGAIVGSGLSVMGCNAVTDAIRPAPPEIRETVTAVSPETKACLDSAPPGTPVTIRQNKDGSVTCFIPKP